MEEDRKWEIAIISNFSLLYFSFEAISGCAQGLLVALLSLLSELRVPTAVPGMEPWLSVYNVSSLSLHPNSFFFFFVIYNYGSFISVVVSWRMILMVTASGSLLTVWLHQCYVVIIPISSCSTWFKRSDGKEAHPR